MRTLQLARITFVVLSCCMFTAGVAHGQQDTQSDAQSVADPGAKSHVLILGDSISIGYTPFVKEMLKDEATVIRPTNENGGAENCAGTTKGIANIDRWLKLDGGNWDVIHFNFGLHDLKHVKPETGANSNDANHPHQASPEKYEAQLREIVEKLKATGAKLVYATTTPVPEGGVRPFRLPADVEKYNEIAARIMKENDIAVDDLFEFVTPRVEELQQPVNVHFSKDGSKALAEEVVKHIRAAIRADE